MATEQTNGAAVEEEELVPAPLDFDGLLRCFKA